MDAQATQRFRTSCPFADSRPDGCICIALKEPKRVSVDYQARFCLSDRHVECRRFQKAVPEIPESATGFERARSLERGTYLIAGTVALCIVLLAGAFIFRGAWDGWLGNNATPASIAGSGALVNTRATAINSAAMSSTQVAIDGMSTSTAIPVLVVTPTTAPNALAMVATTPTETTTAVTPTSTVTPSPTQTPTPTPEPSPTETPSDSATPAPPTPTPTPVVADAATPTTHVVQAGETLSTIAQSYGVSVQAIMTANGIADPDHIEVGQSLTIPVAGGPAPAETPAPETTYTVQPGDTLFAIAQKFGVSVDALMAANGLTNRAFIASGTVLTIPR